MFRVLCAVALCVAALSIACVKARDPPCAQTSHPYGCKWRPDGLYYDCQYCNRYVACANGRATPMTCNTDVPMYFNGHACVRDEKVGAGYYKNCNTRFHPPTGTTPTPTVPTPSCTSFPCCITDCKGKQDGNYGMCSTCNKYITCSGGYRYEMHCPANTVWDDFNKTCVYTSRTCFGCYSLFAARYFCQKLPPGTTYQSCTACNKFMLCLPISPFAIEITCPWGKFYDSKEGKCVPHSQTCSPACRAVTYIPCNPSTFGPYHTCDGCSGYVTCKYSIYGSYTSYEVCEGGTVWDNIARKCVARELSQTCGKKEMEPNECEDAYCHARRNEVSFCRYKRDRYISKFTVIEDSDCSGHRFGEYIYYKEPSYFVADGCCVKIELCKKPLIAGGGR